MKRRRSIYVAVIALTLAGQGTVVAYEVLVARRFGTGSTADALALALTVVLTIGNEVVNWIGTLFVPAYIVAAAAPGAGARSFLRATLLAVCVAMAAAAAMLAAGAPALGRLLAPSIAEAPLLFRLFAPLLVLLPAGAVLSGAMHARRRFVSPSLRQLCWYGGAIGALVLLPPVLGGAAVPLGMAAGAAVFCVLLAFPAIEGQGAADDGQAGFLRLRQLAAPLLPLAFASVSNYVNVSVERAIAARLPEGSLASLTYALRMLNVPLNLFLVNATTMLLPPLAERAARGDGDGVVQLTARALRVALVFAVPLAVLAIVLAEPGVRLLLERGAFTPRSTRTTAIALAWYAPAVIGMAGVQVLLRVYQALQEVRRIVVTGVAVVALNLVLMPVLTALLGYRGLPLALSINALVLFLVMLRAIEGRLPQLSAPVLHAALVTTLAGAVALAAGVLAAAPWPETRMGDLGRLGAGGTAVLVAYIGTLRVIGRDAWSEAVELVAPALGRRAGPA